MKSTRSIKVLAMATAISNIVSAQANAEENHLGLEEVLVTAQKRVQNVQEVPIAISAFDSSALAERGISNVSELSTLAPNVNLDAGTPFSASTSVLSAFIRGIGSDDFAFNIDPGVGVYVDGVYLARSVGANQSLLDVERIEVLKGPQGTLFGRNTIGGAISIVTRDPGDEFLGKVDVTLGSYDFVQTRMSVDIPLTEKLSSSVSANIRSRDGYLDRVAFPDQRASNTPSEVGIPYAGYGSSDSEGGDDGKNVRAKFKWDDDRFSATLIGDYSVERATMANTLLDAVAEIPGPFAGTANLPGTAFDPTATTGFLFGGLYNFCIGSTAAEIAARNAQSVCGPRGTQFDSLLSMPALASLNVDDDLNNDVPPFDDRFVTSDIDKSYATGISFSHLTNWGVSGVVDVELADNLDLKSITAYRKQEWSAGMDLDGSPLNILAVSFAQDQWQASQEFQLLGSADDGNLQYVLGAYFFKEAGDLRDLVNFAGGLLQVDGPNALETDNQAVFGQIDWRISDLVGITVGGRYTRENKEFNGGQQDLNGFNYRLFGCGDNTGLTGNIFPEGAFPLAPIPCQAGTGYPDPSNPLRVYAPSDNEQEFSNFSPKVGVQLYPSDDVMMYGSWSQGYKTGGWTTRLSNPLPDAQSFREEEATTYEVGLKSQFFDNRVQFNAAAFFTEYDDIQLNFQEGVSPTLRNAGDAEIKGIEIETLAILTDEFSINSTLGWIDASYTSIDPGVLAASGPNPLQAGTVEGAELPKTPELQFSLSPKFETSVGSGGRVVVIADLSYASEVWNTTQRTYLLEREASTLLNANITYHSADENWSVTLGGTNLTDERYLVTGQENAAAGTIYGTYNRPTEFYVRLGVNF